MAPGHQCGIVTSGPPLHINTSHQEPTTSLQDAPSGAGQALLNTGPTPQSCPQRGLASLPSQGEREVDPSPGACWTPGHPLLPAGKPGQGLPRVPLHPSPVLPLWGCREAPPLCILSQAGALGLETLGSRSPSVYSEQMRLHTHHTRGPSFSIQPALAVPISK